MKSIQIAQDGLLVYHSLIHLGINDIAFDKRNAFLFIELVKKEIIPILGIDVFRLVNEKVNYSSDYYSWYCERNSGEPYNEYAIRSCIEARKYIENFETIKEIPVFEIVIKDD